MDIVSSDIDWKKILIKKYTSYELDEIDVMVLFVTDSILAIDGNVLITCDILSPYMAAKKEEIDLSLSKLMKKNYLSIVAENNSITTSIDAFKQKIFDDFIHDLTIEKNNDLYENTDDSIYTYLEELQGRSLSPLDRDIVSSWLKNGIETSIIKGVCQSSLTKSGLISFKQADNKILEYERGRSRQEIGASVVNEDTKKTEELKDLFKNSDWTYHEDK